MPQTCVPKRAFDMQYYGCVEDKADKEAAYLFLKFSYIFQFKQKHFTIVTNTLFNFNQYNVQY